MKLPGLSVNDDRVVNIEGKKYLKVKEVDGVSCKGAFIPQAVVLEQDVALNSRPYLRMLGTISEIRAEDSLYGEVKSLSFEDEFLPEVEVFYHFDELQITNLVMKGYFSEGGLEVPEVIAKGPIAVPLEVNLQVIDAVLDKNIPIIFADIVDSGHVRMDQENSGLALDEYFMESENAYDFDLDQDKPFNYNHFKSVIANAAKTIDEKEPYTPEIIEKEPRELPPVLDVDDLEKMVDDEKQKQTVPSLADSVNDRKKSIKKHEFINKEQFENENEAQTENENEAQTENENEAERLESERLENERLESERLENERLENERLENERLEKERLENERLEKERLEKEKEAKRLEKEKEAKRLEEEKEAKRLEEEKEAKRLEEEKERKEREAFRMIDGSMEHDSSMSGDGLGSFGLGDGEEIKLPTFADEKEDESPGMEL